MSNTHTLSGAMQDGRFFTDYRSMSSRNLDVAMQNKIPTWNSTEYRTYLQKNGLKELSKLPSCGNLTCSDYGASIRDSPSSVSPPFTNDPELK